VCSNGNCAPNCAGGSTLCGLKCVDVAHDPGNCGGCGNPCPADMVCSGGGCSLVCGGGTAKCNGKCVDTTVDPGNCGGCNNACPAGQVCSQSGCAATCGATQTNPGPNGGAPGGGNVSSTHLNGTGVDLTTCALPYCIKDWFQTSDPPLKNANELPVAPGCGSGSAGQPQSPRDSVMLVFRLRAPTNSRAFSFNSYFFSAEYPEYVCSSFNDQFIALVDTPTGVPTPIANPADKNLMTYVKNGQKWPIGINIAKGTDLFSVCESQITNPGCFDPDVSNASCSLGAAQLLGTGFDKPSGSPCTIGGGTFWLTSAGNVIPGAIVEIRVAIWDVGDQAFDSLALIDGFKWLPNATLPGTGG
jgi:hypothetical protein